MAKKLRNIPHIKPDGTIDPKDMEAWMRDVYDKFGDANFVDATISGGSGISVTYDSSTGTMTIGLTPAPASANAAASSTSITSADAGSSYNSSVQGLINETKADVNSLIGEFNTLVASLNDLKAKLRTAGLLSA